MIRLIKHDKDTISITSTSPPSILNGKKTSHMHHNILLTAIVAALNRAHTDN